MPVKKRAQAAGGDRLSAMMKALHQVRIEGRPIVELFLEIPDANMYPDYPQIVPHPISLAEIGKRVRQGGYASEDQLIDDLELMAANARAYNGDESPVVDDAVDILDFALLYFGREPSASSRKQLQLQVLNDLEQYKSKGRRLSDAFLVEPDAKTYPDYRQIVKTPSSFTKVREHIDSEGPYANWSEATKEIGLMFHNAMQYNQEGSIIYNDAKALLKQLDAKVAKYSQIPRYLEAALPGPPKKDESESESGSESESEESEIELPRPRDARFDDDDDDDFEADSEDVDDEDIPEEADEEHPMPLPGAELAPIGVDPANMPPPFMQPQQVFDEIVYRPPDEGVEQALFKLVTCQSTPIPAQLAPIDDVKRSTNDIVQLRFPPSPTKAFTTYATTLPYYQSAMLISVYPNQEIKPLEVVVLLNGQKLVASPGNAPGREDYEVTLAPGLNQVSIIAIKASSYSGYVRPYGPPPLAEAEADEERMVLFMNLSK